MAPRILSKLALAAALAAAVPAATLARDGDRDHRPAPGAPVRIPEPIGPPPVILPPPVRHVPPPAPGWQRRDDRREAAWRDAERRRLADRLCALDAEHAAFHARVRNPQRLERYDRSYLVQRAELVRRLSELSHRVAWR